MKVILYACICYETVEYQSEQCTSETYNLNNNNELQSIRGIANVVKKAELFYNLLTGVATENTIDLSTSYNRR